DFRSFGFPAGLRIFRRFPTCTTNPPMVPGDRRDNDCDGRADEELMNGIDDDGDGKIDEDLATPIPVIQAPASVNETECYIPHMRMVSTPKHQAFGMCNVRGNLTIFYKDVSLPSWYPDVTVRPSSLLLATEENVTLGCYVMGNPEPKVMWILPNGQYVDKSYSIQDIENCKYVFVFHMEDIVDVDASVTLKDQVYSESLEDQQSEDFATLARTMKRELTKVFENITWFQRISILGFGQFGRNSEATRKRLGSDSEATRKRLGSDSEATRKRLGGNLKATRRQLGTELSTLPFSVRNENEIKDTITFSNGSVKVIFRVEIKKQNKDENPQVIVNKVGQHLAVSVKGGKLGDYNVVPTVELREKPPPPNKPQASEIQESTVHIQWDPPDLSALFAISGYLLQYKRFGHVTWMTYDTVKGHNHRIDGLDAGTGYLIRTKAQNQYGHSKPSGSLEITTLDTSLSGAEMALIIIIPIIVIIVIIICVALAWFFYKRRVKISGFQRSSSDRLLDNGVVRFFRPAQEIPIDENHKWKDIPRDCLELGRILGEGEFGIVIEGKLTQEDGSAIRCAVKKLKRTSNESDMNDLLNELDIMVQVGSHPNIVNLIGACAFEGSVMVVVEFAANGNLLRHLQKHSSKSYDDMADYQIHIAPKQRLQIASDVANGMAHLARRRCVHRDLAARNILLDENWTAKVSDFGLSRDVYTNSVYEKTTGGKLPAKWMAIEALEAGLNTTKSDV
ncbi:hypothetical protein QZH41_016950, partial [Actinostola sp. cb2023]